MSSQEDMADDATPQELGEPENGEMDEEDPSNTFSENGEEGSDDGDPGEEHEFEIIDQVESEEEGGEEGGENDGKNEQEQKKDGEGDGYDDSSSTDDLDDTELHAMLEKGIDKDTIKKQEQPTDGRPIIKHKTVLKELESDPFDILPEGWVCVTHNCGMPVYLHKETRVCTMARPYSLGNAGARVHDIPISAIPCLQYRKQLNKLKEAATTSATEEQKTSEAKIDDKGDAPAVSDKPKDQQETNSSEPPTVPIEISMPEESKCPVASSQPKPSPRKVWMVTEEESFQKGTADGPKEALHTGHEQFNLLDDNILKLKGSTETRDSLQTSLLNIAVSMDSSSTLDPSTSDSASRQNSEGKCANTETDPTITLHASSKGSPDSASQANIQSIQAMDTDKPSGDNAANTAPQTSSTATSPKIATSDSDHTSVSDSTSNVNVLHEQQNGDVTMTISDNSGSIEDGEIIDEDEMEASRNTNGAKVTESTSMSSTKPSTPSVISTPAVEMSLSTSDKDSNNQVTSSNEAVHVVREEATSSSEPSEIVTSSSNSLATIKRKIESLKNRRGGKVRRTDNNGSAVGWPTENNIAVTPIKLGLDDAASAASSVSTSEKLMAHAAAVKIKSAEERAKESLLDSRTVHNYCQKLFQFKTLEVKKYRSWRERRKHMEERSRRNRPELPPSTKLITCPIPSNLRAEDGGEAVKKREFILNPTGKSYLCILHEYMQRTLKIKPEYEFKELENSKTPYGATVKINNIEYGTGYASSKKVAKHEAAKETLKVLIPDLFKKITDQEIKRNISDLSFFDDIKVTDPRVNELGNKVGQPGPYQLLLECLRRNFGMGNTQCEVSTKPLKNQKCEFTINVGKKHSATVVAKNKREGKQLAAQAILAKLHPHVPSWGSLLRLYGTSVEKPIQKPEDISDIKTHAPNTTVLESLKLEMRKLHKQKEAIQSKGKIIISSKDLPSKMSGVDL